MFRETSEDSFTTAASLSETPEDTAAPAETENEIPAVVASLIALFGEGSSHPALHANLKNLKISFEPGPNRVPIGDMHIEFESAVKYVINQSNASAIDIHTFLQSIPGKREELKEIYACTGLHDEFQRSFELQSVPAGSVFNLLKTTPVRETQEEPLHEQEPA